MSSSDQVERRVAIVTGCGKRIGIGSATARALSAAGLAVAVTDIAPAGVSNLGQIASDSTDVWKGLESLVDEICSRGGIASAHIGDVSVEADAKRMVGEVLSKYGRVDVLVNNAGAPKGRDRVDTADLELSEWENVMRINAGGTFLMSKAVLGPMRRQEWGRIINISSITAIRGHAKTAAYSASKAAVLGFTRALARDVAKSNITVNAVCPGSVVTSRTDGLQSFDPVVMHEASAKRAQTLAMGRTGTPEEIAATVVFLASVSAGYISGQNITVDGGGAV